MPLTRHLILFHKWRHSSIDKWREKLTEADFDGVQQSDDRKGGGIREKKMTPPPPKEKPVIERPGTFNNGGSAFTLGSIVRFKPA